jgi:hypothetical protein
MSDSAAAIQSAIRVRRWCSQIAALLEP